MKRAAITVLAAAMLIVSAGVHAQESGTGKMKVSAGIMSGNIFLYNLDIAAEDIWQFMLGRLPGDYFRQAELEYLKKRVSERQAEKAELLEKGFDITTKVFAEAKKLEKSLQREFVELKATTGAGNSSDLATMKDLREEWREELGEKNLTYLAVQKDNLRDRLLAALKSGDEITLASTKEQYEAAKKKFNDASKIMVNFRTADELESERIEELFFEMDRAELVIQRAERQKTEAERAKWNTKHLLELLDAAKKARDKNDAESLKNLTKDLQKTVRETRAGIERQQAADEAKKDVAVGPKPAEAPKQPPPVPKPPAPKPALKTIPSETVETAPLQLIGPNGLLNGKINVPFEVNFDAQGGLPPYHYQLDSGVGFPPSGIILDVNGRLAGTPKTLHAPRFSVCVVDTVGAQDCELYTIFIEAAPKVAPQPAPQPAPLPKVEVKITVTNKSCSVKQDYSDFTTYTKDMTGTASGPVGTKLILTHTPLPISCGSWTLVDVNSRGNACEREESDPETTNWSFQNPNTATTWTGDTLVVEFAGKYASTGETKCP